MSTVCANNSVVCLQGFWAAGGFRRIYSGLGPAAVGSAPNAAVFFCTYDTVKRTAVGRGVADTASLHMAVSTASFRGTDVEF